MVQQTKARCAHMRGGVVVTVPYQDLLWNLAQLIMAYVTYSSSIGQRLDHVKIILTIFNVFSDQIWESANMASLWKVVKIRNDWSILNVILLLPRILNLCSCHSLRPQPFLIICPACLPPSSTTFNC